MAKLKYALENLKDDINDIVERGMSLWRPPRKQEPGKVGDYWPSIDLDETEDEIRVTAEIPGMDKEDFKVEITGDRLVIRGEKKSTHEERKKDYYYSECQYGSFCRSIPLPCEVDTERAEAKYRKGVLKLTLPKTESSKARRIKIESE